MNDPTITSKLPESGGSETQIFWGRRSWIAALALGLLTLGFYLPTRNFDFLNYDDQAYLNPQVTSGLTLANLHSAMTATVNGNWHPLTTLAWLILASVFGVHPGVFHLTNALLHAVNAALLFAFLRRATGRLWPALFASAIWALHPQRVESVAWISELKDVLCATMWLLCLLAYLRYSDRRTIGRYLLVVAFLALAILAKPMAVTMPAVLLLLDFWLLHKPQSARWRWWLNRWLEKLPLLALSAGGVWIGVFVQIRMHTAGSLNVFPIDLRLKNAAVSYAAYLRDNFFPRHLCILYPHPGMVAGGKISLAAAIAAAVLVLALSIFACCTARSRPYLFAGWFWFVGTLVPVLGLFQSGAQARADRFTYIPAMGLVIAIIWLVDDFISDRPRWRVPTIAAGIIATVALAVAAHINLGYWHDGSTLFTHELEVQPDNYLALRMRCDQLRLTGQNDASLLMGQRAITVAPFAAEGHASYSISLRFAGRYAEAIKQIDWATNIEPWNADYFFLKGITRDLQAIDAQSTNPTIAEAYRRNAIVDFRAALKIDPDEIEAADHLALELAALGDLDNAISVWNQLLSRFPTYAKAQGDLADALRIRQDLGGAVEHYELALAYGARNPAWEVQLSYLVATNPLASTADVQPLVAVAKDACDQSRNRSAAALDAYAACLARVGRFDDAAAAARQGVAQANAAHEGQVAAGIQRRLALYQRGLPYVVSTPTSLPSTATK